MSGIAEVTLERAGFRVAARDRRLPGAGLAIAVVAEAVDGREWCFDVSGAFTTAGGGLSRADTLWRCLGRASVLAARGIAPVVLLTSQLPAPGTTADQALRSVGPAGFFDAVELLSDGGHARLAAYAGGRGRPLPGFWTEGDLRAR